jgi:teichuronic acid biosynthesis glycosyltransferase TuaG
VSEAPAVSVVIPTHQAAAFIERTIRGVLAQTFEDFEVVVVDNGSTDGTGAIVAGIADERIRYHWQEDSGLPGNSRNVGVALARAPLVAFLDADDTWYPQKLARTMAAFADDTSLDLVCHDVKLMLDGRLLKERCIHPDAARMYEELLYGGNHVTTSAVTAKKASMLAAEPPVAGPAPGGGAAGEAAPAGPFSERRDYVTVEDYDLWMRMAAAGQRFAFLHEMLGEYLFHGSNVSGDIELRYTNMLNVLGDHMDRLARAGTLDTGRARWRLARAHLAMARDLAKSGRLGRAATRLAALPGALMAAGRRWR